MRAHFLAVLPLLGLPVVTHAQTTAVTPYGQTVVLGEDFTWTYADGRTPEQVAEALESAAPDEPQTTSGYDELGGYNERLRNGDVGPGDLQLTFKPSIHAGAETDGSPDDKIADAIALQTALQDQLQTALAAPPEPAAPGPSPATPLPGAPLQEATPRPADDYHVLTVVRGGQGYVDPSGRLPPVIVTDVEYRVFQRLDDGRGPEDAGDSDLWVEVDPRGNVLPTPDRPAAMNPELGYGLDPGTNPGSAGRRSSHICDQPGAADAVDDWLRHAAPPPPSGLAEYRDARYDEWGRLRPTTARTPAMPPDTDLSRCQWIWARSDARFAGSLNLGSLDAYVVQRLSRHVP